MAGTNDFLGKGWSFPPAFEGANRGVNMVEGRQDIDQSLHILLSTTIGERVMSPDYGCSLQNQQFEPISSSMLGYIRDLVTNALLYHEARIRVLNIDISEDNSLDALEGRVIISVDYEIRGTNSRYNFVYDFYRTEGAN
jgi:uncharacterized protein